ncbi:hypothetical protein [Aquibacillus kalidii]|uniref:hypothetical protein n=1 Tax=Aquibacillus kalidii TaxID=2762597 RepID=UPI001645C3F8|nr:hypothetical protein [Aquibacillus kalidii]
MKKLDKIVAIIAFVVFMVVIGYGLYKWIRFETIDGSAIFFGCLSLSYFFNWITWGDHEGGGKKDELDRHIQAQSAKIGYFVLMVVSGLILFISEGVSNLTDIRNYPLLIVVGLTFTTLPVTEYFVSRKYKKK